MNLAQLEIKLPAPNPLEAPQPHILRNGNFFWVGGNVFFCIFGSSVFIDTQTMETCMLEHIIFPWLFLTFGPKNNYAVARPIKINYFPKKYLTCLVFAPNGIIWGGETIGIQNFEN